MPLLEDAERIPLAVLGDSDSQGYHDRLWVGESGPERGGRFRTTTFQWTEILAQLRGKQLDLGQVGVWGSHRSVARLADWLGVRVRTPRKQDHRYNFAFAGARCMDLTEGLLRQTPRLVDLMDREPARWQRGVVIVRIGVNSFGMADHLDLLAHDPQAPSVTAQIDQCIQQIATSVALIHQTHPQTHIVLVGILDNADFPPWFDRWQSPRAVQNIRHGLDRYDSALRAMAAADPRVAFFDDRGWFAQRWGQRDSNGRPAYRAVHIGKDLVVSHSQGDEPQYSVLADGHAGVVWNALWAQSLTELMHSSLGLAVTPISQSEVEVLLRSTRPIGP